MKYSREYLNGLMYKDYILLMAEELNNNGFTDNGEKYKVGTNIIGDFVSDFSVGFVLSITDKRAIDFLKDIGLLNNGRCPLTGLMISSTTQSVFNSEHNSSITYYISSIWQEYTKKKRNWGCFVSIPIILIGIVIGVINGFDVYIYTTIGLGILLAILFGMYGASKFGNNWNRTCLSNEIGINTVTLFYILKMEKACEEMNYQNASKYGISSADFDAYMKWLNE
ncbi:MAG: hypothetical protein J6K19_07185 [Prevotella sp.]|nr:hypothetical protein [Prevotella sp.]